LLKEKLIKQKLKNLKIRNMLNKSNKRSNENID
jgi:hypothetical protein